MIQHKFITWRITAALLMTLAAFAGCGAKDEPKKEAEAVEAATPKNEVAIPPESVNGAGIQVEAVAAQSAENVLRFTGSVEANQQQLQQVTPLVSGRVDRVNASLGSVVQRGTVLVEMSSPDVAEMHGKLIEAQAKLNQAEATLRRVKKLSEIGATAGKDLVAAEADAQTARADVNHYRIALQSLGALPEHGEHSIATVLLRAPMAGVVIERTVNPGAGVEAGKPLFTVANLSTVWVIAHVPEAQLPLLRTGLAAEVHSATLGATPLVGAVSYIDPMLDEATRTARVRIEVRNPANRLNVGNFAEVTVRVSGVQTSNGIAVAEDAVQRIGEQSVVFVPKAQPGRYEVRPVTLGEKFGARVQIASGLNAGEQVVTKGSFTLKSALLKSEFAEAD